MGRGQRLDNGLIVITGENKDKTLYRCSKCFFSSTVKRNVLAHLASEHDMSEQRKRLIKSARQDEITHRSEVKKEEGEEEPKPGPSFQGRGVQNASSRQKKWSHPEKCPLCENQVFANRPALLSHIETVHRPYSVSDLDTQPNLSAENFLLYDSGLQDSMRVYRRIPPENAPMTDLSNLFVNDNTRQVLLYELARMGVVRVGLSIRARMIRESHDENEERDSEIPTTFQNVHFYLSLGQIKNITQILQQQRLQLIERMEDFQSQGSGFTLSEILFADIICHQGPTLYSGRGGIPRSKVLQYIKCNFVYPQNFEVTPSTGSSCLIDAVCQYWAGGRLNTNGKRVKRKICTQKELRKFMLLSGLKYLGKRPFELQDVEKFELINMPTFNMRINIHTFNPASRSVYPYLVSKRPYLPGMHDVNLLLLDLPEGISHFILIQNLGRTKVLKTPLEVKQEPQGDGLDLKIKQEPPSEDEEEEEDDPQPERWSAASRNPAPRHDKIPPHRKKALKFLVSWTKQEQTNQDKKAQYFVCPRCYLKCSTSQTLKNHEELCMKGQPQRIKMPPPGSTRCFNSFEKTLPAKFVGVVDFECKVKSQNVKKASTQFRRVDQEFMPISFCLLFFDDEKKVHFERYYESEENIMDLFFEALKEAREVLKPELQRHPFHNLSIQEANAMKSAATHCHICKQKFTTSPSDDYFIASQSARKGELPPFFPDPEFRQYLPEAADASFRIKDKRLGQIRCIDHDHRRERETINPETLVFTTEIFFLSRHIFCLKGRGL